MTKLLEQAFDALGRMPPQAQDEIARALLGLAVDDEPEDVEPEHRDSVLEGMAQAEREEFAAASPDEVISRAFRRSEKYASHGARWRISIRSLTTSRHRVSEAPGRSKFSCERRSD